jgi:hypothetical protein
MTDQTITAKLLGVGGVELGTVELNEVTPQLRQNEKDEESGKLLVNVFIHQTASRSDSPVYIWAWSEGIDSHNRVAVNPDMIAPEAHDPSDYDGGYGEGSYFERAMNKDD